MLDLEGMKYVLLTIKKVFEIVTSVFHFNEQQLIDVWDFRNVEYKFRTLSRAVSIIPGYPKHIFFLENVLLDFPQDPPKSKKVDFQVAPITLLLVL